MLRTCYGHGLTKGAIVQTFYHGSDDPTQGILDARGIFLYNTLNEAFKILKDKVLLKLDFSKDPHIKPKPKIIVSAGGRNINPNYTILMEKLESLATKIDFEFFIRKDLKEIRDGRRGHDASQIYMSDDTPMCNPLEENYDKGYHRGYYDRKPINSYSYPNHNPNRHYPQSQPQNRMPHPSQYSKLSEPSTE
nr:reverse transcriptase domain-containing protein [Tanacetum cinerariifolium]GEY68274.1 reverse transcriptase domain-containing protein [Tanacetum cinerariifolium]